MVFSPSPADSGLIAPATFAKLSAPLVEPEITGAIATALMLENKPPPEIEVALTLPPAPCPLASAMAHPFGDGISPINGPLRYSPLCPPTACAVIVTVPPSLYPEEAARASPPYPGVPISEPDTSPPFPP